jgi:hypothetical protein
MSDTPIYNVVRRAGELAGDTTWRTHGLRHTAISIQRRFISSRRTDEDSGHEII